MARAAWGWSFPGSAANPGGSSDTRLLPPDCLTWQSTHSEQCISSRKGELGLKIALVNHMLHQRCAEGSILALEMGKVVGEGEVGSLCSNLRAGEVPTVGHRI